MTEPTAPTSTLGWEDRPFADEWVARDVLRDFLDLPRRIASTVVGTLPGGAAVCDIGSGPGDFLARFLTDSPDARGVWSDVSEPMEVIARERLAPFGDRVDYVIADMVDLAPLPTGLAVVTTSRASHHLSVEDLQSFYAAVADHLAPGGWVVNLDHTDSGDAWDARLKAARLALIPPSALPSQHPHVHTLPRPSGDQHLAALTAAGLAEAAMPWRSFQTCLFMARKPA